MDVNRISGYIPGKMVFFLMQVMTILNTSIPKSGLKSVPFVSSFDCNAAPISSWWTTFQAQQAVENGKVA